MVAWLGGGVLLLVAVLWVTGLLLANDFAVPSRAVDDLPRTMAVFPHPDDETVSAGGTLSAIAEAGGSVTLVILTRGELGVSPSGVGGGLGRVREKEAARAAARLGIPVVVQGGFADGGLGSQRAEAAAWLATEIARWRPDLVITYDLSGLYGHPDHIACAEIITQLRSSRFPELAVWHACLPGRLVRTLARLGTLQADFPEASRRARPTLKVFVGGRLLAKARAWREYASQRGSVGGWGGRLVPAWIFLTVQPFEYFEAAG
ncbi:MAG TPA: PIG-L deacetylase family protein [Candidatus Dormibacteraeota bacterium]|nr:PIG-L deacetylase family protein [Candidatus Dormibacteraeota bacterium]